MKNTYPFSVKEAKHAGWKVCCDGKTFRKQYFLDENDAEEMALLLKFAYRRGVRNAQ